MFSEKWHYTGAALAFVAYWACIIYMFNENSRINNWACASGGPRGVISTFSWGAKFFVDFSMPPDY